MKFLILVFFLIVLPVNAIADDVERVSSAMKYILEFGIPSRKIEPNKRNSMYKNDSARKELASSIVEAGDKYGISHMLLVAIAYREGKFVRKDKGALGEESTFQVVPWIAKLIRKGKHPESDIMEPECNLKTMRGSAFCAAALLRINMESCKTIKGALIYYATGDKRKGMRGKVKGGKLAWIVKDRFGIARFLDAKFGVADGSD